MQSTLYFNSTESSNKTERRRYLCPLCGKHTVLWLLPDTEIKNLPIKCKRCNKESIISINPINET